jgi:hypothetical protein
MRRSPLPLLLVPILLTACGSSTKITQSWRDPAVSYEAGSVKKMLIIALMRDETTRRQTEDELTAQFRGKGVASYGYLGPLDAELDIERLRNDGFDAVMIMRLADVTQEQTYVPGSYPAYYGSPYGYYGHAYPMYADPGYVRTDMNYRVESNFYSVESQKLVWSGITSTMNPTDLSTAISEIVTAIREKMEREGFLHTPQPTTP